MGNVETSESTPFSPLEEVPPPTLEEEVYQSVAQRSVTVLPGVGSLSADRMRSRCGIVCVGDLLSWLVWDIDTLLQRIPRFGPHTAQRAWEYVADQTQSEVSEVRALVNSLVSVRPPVDPRLQVEGSEGSEAAEAPSDGTNGSAAPQKTESTRDLEFHTLAQETHTTAPIVWAWLAILTVLIGLELFGVI